MNRITSKMAAALFLAALGCKTTDSASSPGDRRSDSGRADGAKAPRGQRTRATLSRDRSAELAGDAHDTLEKGNAEFRDKNYLEAEKYFENVKTKYPFLDAAKEAEIRLADIDFERERFTEARDRYQNFVKLHPTHPKVDYAAFRAALTHYKDIPGEFFILPPVREKDQAEVRAAYKAMNDFVRSYPQSAYLAEAKKIVDATKRRLADHEIYVAEFYAKRNKWAAVANRLETVADKYPGIGYDEKVLFQLHDVYNKLNDKARAEDALRKIISRFPGTAAATRAQQMLGS